MYTDNIILTTYLDLQNKVLKAKSSEEINSAYIDLYDFCNFCKRFHLGDYKNNLTK